MSAYIWAKLLQREPTVQHNYAPLTWNSDNKNSFTMYNLTNTDTKPNLTDIHNTHIHETTAFSIPWTHINKTKYYTLMPVCNISVRLLTYPFNLIKTRISSATHTHYNGTIDAMKQIIRNEGFFALYKGLPVSCFTLTTAPIYLTVLETSRTEFDTLCGTHPTLKPLIPSAAGFVASAVQQIFAVPLDVVTQRMMVSRGLKPVRRWSSYNAQINTVDHNITQSQYMRHHNISVDNEPVHDTTHTHKHRTARQIVHDILQTQGWRGLYRGFVLSVVQYAPFSAITWQVNSVLDPFLRHTLQAMNPIQTIEPVSMEDCNKCRVVRAAPADGFFLNPNHVVDKPTKPRPLTVRDVFVSLISGGVSGMIACLATTPIDVIKTRIQVSESHHRLTSGATIQAIMRERGFSGLAAGTTARVMAVAPSSALLMVSYEVLKRYSLKHELYDD